MLKGSSVFLILAPGLLVLGCAMPDLQRFQITRVQGTPTRLQGEGQLEAAPGRSTIFINKADLSILERVKFSGRLKEIHQHADALLKNSFEVYGPRCTPVDRAEEAEFTCTGRLVGATATWPPLRVMKMVWPCPIDDHVRWQVQFTAKDATRRDFPQIYEFNVYGEKDLALAFKHIVQAVNGR
jgi:hypothetical protein